jgi:hypothetical protein
MPEVLQRSVEPSVRIGPTGRPVATREPAAAVAHDQRSSKRRRHDGGPPSHLERLRPRTDDHATDHRVTRDAAGVLGVDPAGVVERASSPRPALERR